MAPPTHKIGTKITGISAQPPGSHENVIRKWRKTFHQRSEIIPALNKDKGRAQVRSP
jgi:hypothetical protein